MTTFNLADYLKGFNVDNAPLYETPIASTVSSLQDAGRNVWLAGFDFPGTHALVIDADNDTVSIASVLACNGLGRWECSKAHYQHHADIYTRRFPRR